MDRWVYFFVLALATAGAVNAEDYVTTRIPDAFTLRESIEVNRHIYPERTYLDKLAPPTRIQDTRRIRLRYVRPIEMGKTKIILRLKASPKPRKIVQVELRF